MVHPDDIPKLAVMRDYAIRISDLMLVKNNDYFNMLKSGSHIILLAPYNGNIEALISVGEQIQADTIWLQGLFFRENTDYRKKLIELTKDFEIIVTLDGQYIYGSADTYARLVTQYQTLLEIPNIKIAFPVLYMDSWDAFMDKNDGFSRFSVIYRLVHDQVWNVHRDHYLMEFQNPAEMVGYAKGFSFSVRNSIKGVLSARCYSDSRYGIKYSLTMGSLETPLMQQFEPYQYSQQFTVFASNVETMSSFIEGCGGDELWNLYKERLDVIGV